MARQRILKDPVMADIDGVKTQYEVVRITRLNFDIGQVFDQQRMYVDWAVGTLVPDEKGIPVFSPSPYGQSGTRGYDNSPPGYAFGILLQKTLSQRIGPFLDQIFADLEADGLIKPGTQEDYGLA